MPGLLLAAAGSHSRYCGQANWRDRQALQLALSAQRKQRDEPLTELQRLCTSWDSFPTLTHRNPRGISNLASLCASQSSAA